MIGRELRRALGWHAEGPVVIGFLGRFTEEKGILQLAKRCDQLTTPWRALFVGGGPLERRLRTWAVGHGDRVRIVTGVSHDLVPAHLNAMDVLCAPSLTTQTWREQFGRMLIEAFACGIPVVASDSGEIPHVVEKAGLVVGESDEVGWVKRLTEVIASPALREEISALGLERARRVYAWPVIARKHLDFFETLTPEIPGAGIRPCCGVG